MLNKEQKIVSLLNKGYTTAEIANKLKIKIYTVYYYAKKNNIKIKKRYTGGQYDKYILENLNAGKTQNKIAEELGFSPAFIQQRVKAIAKEEARRLALNE